MKSNCSEDEFPSSRDLEEIESPRKRPRMDNSGRKSWSLMDRKADHEILQEMGVSLLEPDDNELLYDPGVGGMSHHKSHKRKRDIENMNPNINCMASPRGKLNPKSPRVKSSPGAGPSKVKSPRSTDKLKPLQPTDQHVLETTLIDEYLVDEETPLAQCVSAQYVPPGPGFSAGSLASGGRGQGRCTPLGLEDELTMSRRYKPEPTGTDSFAALSDEMILSVFRWLPKRTLVHCMTVCKRWHRVARDETLWQRLDLGNKTIAKDALGRILARKPIIVRLASSEIGEWHPTSPATPSRIQFLDLSITTIDTQTLNSLLERCPVLRKLSLESVRLENSTCDIIAKCTILETLNLTMAQGLTPEGLTTVLKGCASLQSLNISWCNLNESSLEVLVTTLPQRLQRLNVGGARIMKDDMVEQLVRRCPRLLELDLSDCSHLTGRAVLALLALNRLEYLAVSRCYLLPAQTLTAIARPTVGSRRTSIWGLRTRD